MITLEHPVNLVLEGMQQDIVEARGEAIVADAVNLNSKGESSTFRPQITILS